MERSQDALVLEVLRVPAVGHQPVTLVENLDTDHGALRVVIAVAHCCPPA